MTQLTSDFGSLPAFDRGLVRLGLALLRHGERRAKRNERLRPLELQREAYAEHLRRAGASSPIDPRW